MATVSDVRGSGIVGTNTLKGQQLVAGNEHFLTSCDDRILRVASVGPQSHPAPFKDQLPSDLIWFHDPDRHYLQECDCTFRAKTVFPRPTTEGDIVGRGYSPQLVQVGEEWWIVALSSNYEAERTEFVVYRSADLLTWSLEKSFSGKHWGRLGFCVIPSGDGLTVFTRDEEDDRAIKAISFDAALASTNVWRIPSAQLQLPLFFTGPNAKRPHPMQEISHEGRGYAVPILKVRTADGGEQKTSLPGLSHLSVLDKQGKEHSWGLSVSERSIFPLK